MKANLRIPLFGALVLALSVLSCGREITGPVGAANGAVALRPVFSGVRLAEHPTPIAVTGLVEFVRVRIVLLRSNGDTAVNRVVEFPADSQSIALTIPVVMSAAAPQEGETFVAALRFVNAQGDTVFSGGPIAVQARPLGAPPVEPPTIPLAYTGPGASAASLVLSADTVRGRRTEKTTLSATVRDAQGAILTNVPIAYLSTDTTQAVVDLKSGEVTFRGIRGRALIVAQTLTGQADTAVAQNLPVPTALAFLPEALGQRVRQGETFPKPFPVRVVGADSLPVAGTIVTFSVTRGKGRLSQIADTTDASGVASVTWTAGDTAAVGELTARVQGTTLTATVTAEQLSSGPTSVRVGAVTSGVRALDTLPSVAVVVLDATQDTVRAFTGQVTLAVTGPSPLPALIGTTTVNATAGVARFTDLVIDQQASGLRLRARVTGTSIEAVSDSFSVAPARATAIQVVRGADQSTIPEGTLADPIVFRTIDRLDRGVANQVLTVTVTEGGGTVTPSTLTTDSTGFASVRWTLGSGTTHRLSAVASGVPAASVAAYLPQGFVPLAGAGQKAFHGEPASDSIAFRVVREGGIALRGIPVDFRVTEGGGTVSPTKATSDSVGVVRTRWTAGSAFDGDVGITASIPGLPSAFSIATVKQGTPKVVRFRFDVPPVDIVAGDTFPTLSVATLNGFGDTAKTFTGPVRVVLAGGPDGARLLGTATVNAVAGVARFPGLTVDRAFVGYRLLASLPGDTTVAAHASAAFTVSAAPAQTLTLVSGGGQQVPEKITLPDSIVIVAKDRFGFTVSGAVVSFTVLQGGGSVSAATRTTNGLGRAAIAWTAGPEGPQRLAATMPGLDTVFVTATALASNGAPVLFFSTTMAVRAPVGQTTPIRVYLSNPTPSPVPVTLTMATPGTARWVTETATIPVGGLGVDLQVIGEALGEVLAIASSPVGVDSIPVLVDSATVRVGSTAITAFVTDTVRTRIILDTPAPAGGLSFTVTSLDPSRVRVAAGTGRGSLDQDEGCFDCFAVTDGSASILGTPGETATITIAAGESVGQLVILPVDSTLSEADVAVRVSAVGFADRVIAVRATPLRFSPFWTFAAPTVLGVGQYAYGEITLDGYTKLRRDVVVTVRAIDATVEATDSVITIPRGTAFAAVERFITGRRVGTGRFALSATGFPEDTLSVTVQAAALTENPVGFGERFVHTNATFTQEIAFGSVEAPSPIVLGGPRTVPTRITITVANPAILEAPASVDVPAGQWVIPITLRTKGVGITAVTFAAEGHLPYTMTYTVSGESYTVTPTLVPVALTESITLQRTSYDYAAASEWTVTSSNPEVIRVLTPTVAMPAGVASQAVVRVEGRTGITPPASVLLTFSNGSETIERSVGLFQANLRFDGPSLSPLTEADSVEREIRIYAGTTQRFAAPVEGRLRVIGSAGILVVTDSVLRLVPDSTYAVARVKAIGVGSVALSASAPGFGTTSVGAAPAPVQLRYQIPDPWTGVSYPPSGPVRVGQGLVKPFYVQRRSPTTAALPLTFSGTTLVAIGGTPTIASGEESQLLSLRGGTTLGEATLAVSTPGLASGTMTVAVVPADFALGLDAGSLAVEQRAELSTRARTFVFPEYQRVADSTWLQLVSLDTMIARVEQDTILLIPTEDGAVRRARIRGISPGIAQLRVLRRGTSDTVGTFDFFVEAPRLVRGFVDGDVILGMQQQTEPGEIYLERSHVTRRDLWVHLRSSAPQLVSVPDSVRIPADSSWVAFLITSGDSVGGATITASADRHSGLSFPVSVTRNRLLAVTRAAGAMSDEAGTGVETTVEVQSVTPASGGGFDLRSSTSDAALYDYAAGGYLRPTRVRIPVRLRVADPALASIVQDTSAIPIGAMSVRWPAVRGLVVGTTALVVEDRRAPTAFTTQVASAVNLKIVPSAVVFRRESSVIEVPLQGSLATSVLWVESKSTIDSLTATLSVVPTPVGESTVTGVAIPSTALRLLPRSTYEESPCTFYGYCRPKAKVTLTGLVLGRHTLVVTAPGHRPDTITVEVTKPIITATGFPVNITTAEALPVTLGFTSSTGAPITLSAPVTFDLITEGTAAQTTVGGTPVTTLTVPAGATSATFVVKGVSAGTVTVKVNAPNFTPYRAVLTVRTP